MSMQQTINAFLSCHSWKLAITTLIQQILLGAFGWEQQTTKIQKKQMETNKFMIFPQFPKEID